MDSRIPGKDDRDTYKRELAIRVSLELSRMMADFSPDLLRDVTEGQLPEYLRSFLAHYDDLTTWLSDLSSFLLQEKEEGRRLVKAIHRSDHRALDVLRDDEMPPALNYMAWLRIRDLLMKQS